MIIRLLILLCCLGLIVYLASRWVNKVLDKWRKVLHEPQKKIDQKLVKCNICHTFVPIEEAVEKKGEYYCEKHRD